jgi:hypothetical protein
VKCRSFSRIDKIADYALLNREGLGLGRTSACAADYRAKFIRATNAVDSLKADPGSLILAKLVDGSLQSGAGSLLGGQPCCFYSVCLNVQLFNGSDDPLIYMGSASRETVGGVIDSVRSSNYSVSLFRSCGVIAARFDKLGNRSQGDDPGEKYHQFFSRSDAIKDFLGAATSSVLGVICFYIGFFLVIYSHCTRPIRDRWFFLLGFNRLRGSACVKRGACLIIAGIGLACLFAWFAHGLAT